MRPDTSLARARNADEARPILNAEARLDIVYDLLENWPPAKAVKESGLMASESKLSITMRPALEVSGSMQWDLRNSETAQWSFTGELPPALPKLGDLDQFRSLEIYGGSSVGAAFHVDVLLDLVLSIDTPFAPISLLNFHDDLRVLNIEGTGPNRTREWPRQARFTSQASQILKGKPFTQYDTLAGAISTADNQGVQAHLRACTTEPLAGSVIPPAKWTPGDPKALAVELRTACNVCAAWAAGTTTDSAGKHVSYPGFGPGLILPASQAGKSPSLRWLCDAPTKNGCHDICKIESGALTVVQTAVELQAMGGKTNCNAAAPVVIH